MGQTAIHLAFAVAYAAIFLGTLALARTRKPWAAAVLTGSVPFALYTHLRHTDLTLAKFALLGALVGLLSGGGLREAFNTLRNGIGAPMLYALAAVAAVAAASIAVASYPAEALRQTLKDLQYLVLFAVTALLAQEDAEPAVLAAAAATLAVALAAIAQLWTGAPSALPLLGEIVPRVAGPLEGPNQLAAFLDVALPLLLAYGLRTRQDRARSTLYGAALAAGCAALLLTFSRAGIATGFGALVLVLIWRGRAGVAANQTPAKAGALGILGGFALSLLALARAGVIAHPLSASTALLGRADTTYVGGIGTRSELWRAAIALWGRHKLLGVGAGNFELELGRVGLHGVRTHANSAYLQALAETGIVGLAALIALTLASIFPYWLRARRSALCAGIAAGSAALAVHGAVDLLTFFEKVGQFWICVCALPAARAGHDLLDRKWLDDGTRRR
ncbi:hypothetical protein EPN52_08250 [bacterium]|nr:MAG: hypothetical protein EPN52_08250 [bacterium]